MALVLVHAFVLAGAASADTIKEFVVSGTAPNFSAESLGSCAAGATCSFSGRMMVDVTSSAAFPRGTVAVFDITFPGLAAFNKCCLLQEGISSVWFTDSINNTETEALFLDFQTTHTPVSLVGFDGGSIVGNSVVGPQEVFYLDLSGSITPVPEPSSLTLLGGGVLVFTQVLRRKLS